MKDDGRQCTIKEECIEERGRDKKKGVDMGWGRKGDAWERYAPNEGRNGQSQSQGKKGFAGVTFFTFFFLLSFTNSSIHLSSLLAYTHIHTHTHTHLTRAIIDFLPSPHPLPRPPLLPLSKLVSTNHTKEGSASTCAHQDHTRRREDDSHECQVMERMLKGHHPPMQQQQQLLPYRLMSPTH